MVGLYSFCLINKAPMFESKPARSAPLRPIPNFIFASRWLQLPLCVGLIAAQVVYVFTFWLS